MEKIVLAYILLICVFTFVGFQQYSTQIVLLAGVIGFSYVVYEYKIKNNLKEVDVTYCDEALTEALKRFKAFRPLDIGEHDLVLVKMHNFIQLYKHILIGNKPFALNVDVMTDIRRDTINILYSFHCKKQIDMTSIIDDVTFSTLRLLRILRAKYKVKTPMFPCGYNASTENDIL